MMNVGLFLRLEAKPGKERDVEDLLLSALELVQKGEPFTTTWFALRMGPLTFAIFDTFPDEAGRVARLSGEVAKTLSSRAPDLLSRPPTIEKVHILAVKLPA